MRAMAHEGYKFTADYYKPEEDTSGQGSGLILKFNKAILCKIGFDAAFKRVSVFVPLDETEWLADGRLMNVKDRTGYNLLADPGWALEIQGVYPNASALGFAEGTRLDCTIFTAGT